MQTWTFIRFLHLVAMAFFVGGQLVLVAAIAPVMHKRGEEGTMRALGRRFGIASAVALVMLIGTGAAMASHYGLWSSEVLRFKLLILALVFVLTGLHVVTPYTRAISLVVPVASLVIVYLGVKLTYG